MRFSPDQCSLQSFDAEISFQCDAYAKIKNVAAEPVNNCDQVDEATLEPDIGYIDTPDLINPYNRYVTQKVWIYLMPWGAATQVWAWVDRHQPHQAQQMPGTPCAYMWISLLLEPVCQLVNAQKRMPSVLFIQESHQGQVLI